MGVESSVEIEIGVEKVDSTTALRPKEPGLFASLSWFVVVLTFFAGIGGFLFGYDTGVISGAILVINDDIPLTPTTKEIVVSSAVAGAAVASACSGFANDYFGRKKVIMGACLIFGAGAIVMAAAMDLTVLIIGRVLAGIGIGLASQTVPVYIAESAPESIRGTLVSIDVLLITGGQFVSYVVDAIFLDVPGNWRWMLGLSFVPAFIQFVGMIFLPESPRWLASHGRDEKALNILKKTRNTLAEAETEMENIKATINLEKIQMQGLSHHRLVEMFVNKTILHCLIIGVGMQIWQQVCGINTVMYYSSSILLAAGFGSEDDPATAIYCSMLVAFANMLMSVVAVLLIDRVGRRPLALFSLIGVILSLLLLSLSFHGDGIAWLSLTSLILYIVFFAPGMGPIPWAVNSEIYPLFVRAPANSIATSANWVSNLIVSFTFLSLTEAVGETITFLLYAVIAFCALLFVFFLLPETKGLTLEDVQSVFATKWFITPFCFSSSSSSPKLPSKLPVSSSEDDVSAPRVVS